MGQPSKCASVLVKVTGLLEFIFLYSLLSFAVFFLFLLLSERERNVCHSGFVCAKEFPPVAR
jgi:hypothetical protein